MTPGANKTQHNISFRRRTLALQEYARYILMFRRLIFSSGLASKYSDVDVDVDEGKSPLWSQIYHYYYYPQRPFLHLKRLCFLMVTLKVQS